MPPRPQHTPPAGGGGGDCLVFQEHLSLHCYAIVQAGRRWLPTAVALVRSQARPGVIYVGRNDTRAGSLRVHWFPPPILIPPTAPYSLIILTPTLYSLDTDSVVKQQT
jgi:hypothetical protein